MGPWDAPAMLGSSIEGKQAHGHVAEAYVYTYTGMYVL